MRGGSGFSLTEVLVSLAMALCLGLAATALLVTLNSSYRWQEESQQVEENGRQALEILTRAVRQAGYVEPDTMAADDSTLAIAGLDNATLKGGAGIESAASPGLNGSDVLELRFAGSADGAMLNCGGFAVGAGEVGQHLFFVASEAGGEPELRCRYLGKGGNWATEAIASGIDSFQVRYGLDEDGDGLAERYLSAAALARLEQQRVAGKAGGRNYWQRIITLQVALLVRGPHPMSGSSARYDLFGAGYAGQGGSADAGSTILVGQLPAASRNRLRKIFQATVQLRNFPAAAAP